MGRNNTTGIDYSIPYGNNPLWQTHSIWKGMVSRCNNPKHSQYKYYGARGISVCPEWENSFKKFLEDMKVRPEKRSIDRIDPDGDYCPENTRWATGVTQAINTRPKKGEGVFFRKKDGIYEAYMRSYGTKLHLGVADDEETALKIRKAAEILRKHLMDIGVYV